MRRGFLACWVLAAAMPGGLAGPWGGVALGQTIVGGVVGRDTTWTLDGSPYIVTETIQIFNGAALTVEPGVEVVFEQGQGLDAGGGVLVADGLGGDRIVFRSADGLAGSWPGITTGGAAASLVTAEGDYISGPIFRNVRISDAGRAVQCRFEPAYFEDVVIERCPFAGVSFRSMSDSTIWLKGVTIRDAGLGLEVAGAQRVTLLDCVLEDNPGGGARIGVSDGGTAERCVFRRNGRDSVPIGGGGALLTGNWTVRDCLFEQNEAIASSSGRGGGGLKLNTRDSTIVDCEFVSNTSRYAGGGAEVRPFDLSGATVRVDRCRFMGNECLTTSGAGMLAGGTGLPELDVEIVDCHFEANHGDKNGGLAVGAASGEISGCSFLGNTARTSAGGLRIYDDVLDLVIRGNTFVGNATDAAGGAIDMTNTRGATGIVITGNVFEGNRADAGGAIGGLAGSTVAVAGNRFVDNSARLGGAVHVRANLDAVTLAGGDGLTNRFAGNTADLGSDIYNASPDAIDATGNCWGTDDLTAIAERIFDASDDPTKGVVAFDPIATDCDACPADLDADGELTIFDFLAFQNLFDAGDPRADFDGDGEFTIFDFLAFQNAFDAGC